MNMNNMSHEVFGEHLSAQCAALHTITLGSFTQYKLLILQVSVGDAFAKSVAAARGHIHFHNAYPRVPLKI